MRIKVLKYERTKGCIVYRIYLGTYFTDLSYKELIDLFTEITNAVPTASNKVPT